MREASINANLDLDFSGSEAINSICSNLLFAGKNIKKIVITSCEPNDGKSFVAMHVAVNMARRGKKALLIDADMRLSFLNARYDIRLNGYRTGLAHYLSGQCILEDAVYQTDIQNVYLIPVGKNVQGPLSLITAPDFDKLIQEMGERFDLVIIDAPPIGLVIDAAEIAKSCDGSILVVEYAKTRLRSLRGAKQQMERTGTPLLGCILNKVALNRLNSNKYYSDYGEYGYSRYQKKITKKKANLP